MMLPEKPEVTLKDNMFTITCGGQSVEFSAVYGWTTANMITSAIERERNRLHWEAIDRGENVEEMGQ
jgi:hypothetical protein